MAEVEGDTRRFQYRQSVREHVRAPLATALEHVDREAAELHAERTAFERFAEKVATISPMADGAAAGANAAAGGALALADDQGAKKRAAVREAYRETVLTVDHYEEIYGEPLLVNVAGELSEDLATALADDAGVPFTEHLQSVLRAAAVDAADRRREFHDRILAERESLETAREELREVIETLDGSGLPSWYRPSFDDRLDDLVERRQDRLQSRAAYRQDGHDLCEYVYASEPWTYPVLTAIARLHNSVG